MLVVGRPSSPWGQEIVAVMRLIPHEATTRESICDIARSDLARYKLPKDVVIVGRIKRTPAGEADFG